MPDSIQMFEKSSEDTYDFFFYYYFYWSCLVEILWINRIKCSFNSEMLAFFTCSWNKQGDFEITKLIHETKYKKYAKYEQERTKELERKKK